jgi:hypothetical protein
MRVKNLGRAILTATWLVLAPAATRAGMPYFPPTEPPEFSGGRGGFTGLARLTSERLEAVSFFLLGILACAWVVRAIWNGLRTDFPALPRLSFGKALGLVVLWGFLFVLVLTMISGARELMTPGAWKRQGATYTLVEDPAPPPPQPDPDETRRRAGLERLRDAAKLRYEEGRGRFPSRADLPDEVFHVPGSPGKRYLYIEGLTDDHYGSLLACEPEGDGSSRYVLLVGGEVRLMPETWVRERFAEAKP